MFIGRKFATSGVQQQIPIFLQNILWYLVETMPIREKHHMQVFTLEPVTVETRHKLRILHTQVAPEYRQEYTICTKSILTSQIYVLDDHDRCIMMLSSEY